MKKTLIAFFVASFALCSTAHAGEREGYYVQFEGGAGQTKISEEGESLKKSGYTGRVAWGHDFSEGRVQLDYTKFADVKVSEQTPDYNFNSKLTNHSIGASAIFNMGQFGDLTPYVGARVSYNLLKVKGEVSGGGYSESASSTRSKFGFGGMAGLEYRVAKQSYVNIGGYYDYIGKVDQVKVANYGGLVGFRQTF